MIINQDYKFCNQHFIHFLQGCYYISYSTLINPLKTHRETGVKRVLSQNCVSYDFNVAVIIKLRQFAIRSTFSFISKRIGIIDRISLFYVPDVVSIPKTRSTDFNGEIVPFAFALNF